jgi:hypothetical protein
MLCLLTAKVSKAQEIDITGEWTMYEMIWTTGEQVNTTTEEQLKAEDMFSDYSFMPEGKLKLVSNMTGSGNLESMDGKWKLDGDKLTCTFVMEGIERDLVWDFESKDDSIHLIRTSPDGSTTVVNSFKRK